MVFHRDSPPCAILPKPVLSTYQTDDHDVLASRHLGVCGLKKTALEAI
jgi:hypothetical protein